MSYKKKRNLKIFTDFYTFQSISLEHKNLYINSNEITEK